MVGQQEPVVTGDAVILDIQIAQLPVRALSALIDIIVVFVCYVIGVVLWAATLSQFDSAFSAAVLIVFTVLALVGYPVIFETATRGKTLGQMALGLRVVSDDGGPERFRQALFRALAAVVEIWAMTGGPAVICSLLNSKGKRIGDIFAGTVVITERAPKLSAPPLMPAPLAPWAATLQLSGLAPEQAELARQFLSRASQLHPQVRDQMAYRITSDVVAQISPPPPPGTPPAAVLAAVLAERHRRELSRLQPAQPIVPPPQWAVPPPQWPPGTQWPPAPSQQWPPAPSPTDHRPYPVAPTQAPSAPRSDGFTPPS